MSNNKQTAVEWLFERINLFCMFTDGIPDEWLEALEQAKEMEKQQIIKAHMNVNDDRDYRMQDVIIKEFAEQYYNEQYGGNND